MLLRGRLDGLEEEGVATGAVEVPDAPATKGGMSGLKVVFFFPLFPREDMMEVMALTSFS